MSGPRSVRRTLEEQLIAAVDGLLRSGAVSLATGGTPADELAARFDEAYTEYIGSLTQIPAESKLIALQALDTAIHELSGVENAALWKEAAVLSDPRWNELREIARIVLVEFDV